MKRRLYSDPMNCNKCGAPILADEEFEWCGVCYNPIHKDCAVWQGHKNGSGFICPGCGGKETDE